MIPLNLNKIEKEEFFSAIKSFFSKKDSIKELENQFCKKTGQKAIVVDSGSEALRILLTAYGLRNDDEILFPSYMCEQTAKYLIDSGFKLKFVDLEKGRFNISLSDLKKKITRNTKAVIAAHLFGKKCEINKINKICKKRRVVLIEDCAQLIKKPDADNAIFSMCPGKILNSFGGGIISCKNRKILKKCMELRGKLQKKNVASVLFKILLFKFISNPAVYSLIYPITCKRRTRIRNQAKKITKEKKRITSSYSNIQAALALYKLSKNKFNETRTILISKQADEELNELKRNGIDAVKPYPYLPAFFNSKDDCPNAKKIAEELIIFRKNGN